MRRALTTLVLAGGLAAAGVPVAAAHEGHESCGGGAPGFLQEFPGLVAQGPGEGPAGSEQSAEGAGVTVSDIGKSGQAGPSLEAFHALFCEPKP
jgi:hypothetical protein